jgi:tetratricopeptide (TPR) repeat protein
LQNDYALAWQNSGQINADLGRTEAAIAAFRRALELDAQDAVAHFGLANALAEGPEPAETAQAESHYQAALELDPDYVEAWNNLGNLLADSGRLSPAVAAFREAVRRRPDDAALPLNMAKKLEAGGRFDEARQAYRATLKIEPGHLAGLAGRARAERLYGRRQCGRKPLPAPRGR